MSDDQITDDASVTSQIVPVPSNYPGFLLQIVRPNGTVIRLPAGGKLETDLIALCVQFITARGVGVFRTTTHVAADIRQGMAEALMAYKLEAATAQHTVEFGPR